MLNPVNGGEQLSPGITIKAQPVGLSDVSNLNAQRGVESVFLTWKNPQGTTINGIKIDYAGKSIPLGAGIEQKLITRLTGGQSYTFTVTLDLGTGTPGTGRSVTAQPVAMPEVTGLTQQSGVSEVALSWQNPASLPSNLFKGIRITYSSTNLDLPSSTQNKVIEKLPAGSQNFTVQVIYGNPVNSNKSSSPGRSVQAQPTDFPEISNLKTTKIGVNQASLNWTSPPANSLLLGLTLSYNSTGIALASGSTTETLNGLLAGETYSFKIITRIKSLVPGMPEKLSPGRSITVTTIVPTITNLRHDPITHNRGGDINPVTFNWTNPGITNLDHIELTTLIKNKSYPHYPSTANPVNKNKATNFKTGYLSQSKTYKYQFVVVTTTGKKSAPVSQEINL